MKEWNTWLEFNAELFELSCLQSSAHTQIWTQSCQLYPLPGGEEALHLHPLWTPLLLGMHHWVVQHQGQAYGTTFILLSFTEPFCVRFIIPPRQHSRGYIALRVSVLPSVLPSVRVSNFRSRTRKLFNLGTSNLVWWLTMWSSCAFLRLEVQGVQNVS